eukprot:6192802-Pleurochrysis_carterae.AAC.1
MQDVWFPKGFVPRPQRAPSVRDVQLLLFLHPRRESEPERKLPPLAVIETWPVEVHLFAVCMQTAARAEARARRVAIVHMGAACCTRIRCGIRIGAEATAAGTPAPRAFCDAGEGEIESGRDTEACAAWVRDAASGAERSGGTNCTCHDAAPRASKCAVLEPTCILYTTWAVSSNSPCSCATILFSCML